jgi:DNA invertase Pin-like site-specific DNA recombinase
MGSSERRIPTARGMLQQMAAVAELEAGLISNRTKAALAAAKARGKKLGDNRGVKLAPKAREAGRAELVKRAKARATELAPTIAEIREEGVSGAAVFAVLR